MGNEFSELTIELYRRFLDIRNHPDIFLGKGSKVDQFTMEARFGNLSSACEAVKSCSKEERRRMIFFLKRALDVYPLFLVASLRKWRLSEYDYLAILLKEGHYQTARYLVDSYPKKHRWDGYLVIYRKTNDPLDAVMMRKYVVCIDRWDGVKEGILSRLQTTAIATKDSRDISRAERFFHKIRPNPTLQEEVTYFASRYKATGDKQDLARAKSLANSLPRGSSCAVEAWEAIVTVIKSAACLKQLRLAKRRAKEALAKLEPIDFDDCLKLARDTGKIRHLQRALAMIDEEPDYHKQYEMVKEASWVCQYMPRGRKKK